MVVTLSNVHKTYGEQSVLKGVTFFVGPRDKVALIGRNGCGKTTILRIITGAETPDEGSVTRTGRTSVAFRPQQDSLDLNATVYQEMKAGRLHLIEIEHELAELDELIARSPEERHLKRHAELWNSYEHAGGLTWKEESDRILTGLGLEGRGDSLVRELSGGEKTKLSLAKLLGGNFDLLILDEPSNHLDLDTTIWLENYLREFPKAVLLVTHDRSLLRGTATRVIEIENGRAEIYNCPFDDFLDEREIRWDTKIRTYERQLAFIRKEEEYIRRNIEGVNTKQAQGRRKRLERVELPDRPHTVRGYRFPLKARSRSGEIVLRVENIALGYEDRVLFRKLSFEIYRNERLAIVGANGTGKTTLLRAIAGLFKPLEGTIKLGVGIDSAFFDQEHTDLQLDESPINMTYRVLADATEQSVRDTLGAFGFSGLAVDKHIGTLSGGERTRLSLMKVVLSGANLLMLDEPTNHLDIEAIDAMRNSLTDYDGTLILVSHDRDFLTSVCNRFLVLGDKPKLITGANAFEDYIASRGGIVKPHAKQEREKAPAIEYKERKRLVNELKRFEERLKKLETDVTNAETEKAKCESGMFANASDYIKVAELDAQHKAIMKSIDDAFSEMIEIEAEISRLRELLEIE